MFVFTLFKFDLCHETQQAQGAPCHAFRIRHSVAAEPMPEVLGLADVENDLPRIPHQVNTGTLRE